MLDTIPQISVHMQSYVSYFLWHLLLVLVSLKARAETALIDRICINIQSCAVRLEGSIKKRKNWFVKRCILVISVYAPIDCNPNAIKDEFYHQLNDLKKAQILTYKRELVEFN